MTLKKGNGIETNGIWFSDGHVEVGGDDSISYTSFGSKLFLRPL